MTRTKQVLLVILGSLLLGCGLLLAPWVLVGVGLGLDKASKERERRAHVPTDLVDAVRFEYVTPAQVAAFLDKGQKIDQQVDVGNGRVWPLVRVATETNNVEVARLLLHRGGRIDEAGVWWALRNGQEQMARMLIQEGAPLGPAPDAEPDIGRELIQAAALGHQPWAVRLLVQKGADPKVRNARGDGLLNLSVETESMTPGPVSDSLETTRTLLEVGADPRTVGMIDYTPLHWAAQNGKLDEAKLLMAAGASVDGPPGRYGTPLGAAVSHCRPEAAALLLEHGASRDGRTPEGKGLREGACWGGYPEKSDREKIAALLR